MIISSRVILLLAIPTAVVSDPIKQLRNKLLRKEPCESESGGGGILGGGGGVLHHDGGPSICSHENVDCDMHPNHICCMIYDYDYHYHPGIPGLPPGGPSICSHDIDCDEHPNHICCMIDDYDYHYHPGIFGGGGILGGPSICSHENVDCDEHPNHICCMIDDYDYNYHIGIPGVPPHAILCPGQSELDFCDCGYDCDANPTWCSCTDAVECCKNPLAVEKSGHGHNHIISVA